MGPRPRRWTWRRMSRPLRGSPRRERGQSAQSCRGGWVDGIHVKVRLDTDNICLLVMIGVRADGRKEFKALSDGYRESSESWADLLRDCKRRGMRAPVLVVGDGAGLLESRPRRVPHHRRTTLMVP